MGVAVSSGSHLATEFKTLVAPLSNLGVAWEQLQLEGVDGVAWFDASSYRNAAFEASNATAWKDLLHGEAALGKALRLSRKKPTMNIFEIVLRDGTVAILFSVSGPDELIFMGSEALPAALRIKRPGTEDQAPLKIR